MSMVNYEAVEGSPELAAIRKQSQALKEKALQGTVRTGTAKFGGDFAIGKGVSHGANQAFLDAYTKAVKSGTSGRAIMMAVTGNISRDMPNIQQFMASLEANKIPKTMQDVQQPVLPQSHYQDIIGNPENLMPQKEPTETEQAQIPSQVLNMAPRVDTVDIMAPSILPHLNPPTQIPSNAIPNNLVDANAETTVATTLTTGDSYLPGEPADDDPYAYAIQSGDDQGDVMDDASQQDIGLMFGA